ncbi:MAG TPA: PA14 domain-containing protein [Planctomycetota bacterium]|nr:PA14 domain-containing protein [Planctomycetota bacterium]
MRALWLPVAVSTLAASCSRTPGAAATAPAPEALAAWLAVARAGCGRCHAAPTEAAMAPERGPDLREAVRWHRGDGGVAFLQRHHGGDDAPDLAAWLVSIGGRLPPAAGQHVSPAAFARGERLLGELGCQACHARAGLESLAARTDHRRLAAFLRDPAPHRPGVPHVRLEPAEADAVAAWLLRAQLTTTAPEPGFAWQCFERRIETAELPELEGLEPSASGVAPVIDASLGSREHHFALRFEAALDVPATGDWTFVCGSDDSSWLWIDDTLVVRNEGLAPHHREQGTVRLEAGRHEVRVVFTQAGGGRSLEVLWQGPGVDEQPLPAARATATRSVLVPPAPPAPPDAEAAARGLAAANARRCASCHAPADTGLAEPGPPPARAWSALRGGPCPQVPGAEAIWSAAVAAFAQPLDTAGALQLAMLRDGCLSCHVRDGRGGLPPVAKKGLAEVEDLGDEGRLPPDLTAVGRRLRPAWIEQVLAEGRSVRPYLRLRMPPVGAERAHQYAAWFDAVDGRPGDDDEVPFTAERAQLGQKLVSVGGRNCVTCHPFAGQKALGPQGMDLSIQHARLRPAWLREWLLEPNRLRPGTRMPALWTRGDAADRADVDAIAAWLSLGEAAPVPAGLAVPKGSYVLLPTDRPRLHGAFLKGLSARCVAVGTPERVHYAYDVAHARLAWIWRGAFLDAEGTWSGRAGKLLEPLGTDRVVLEDLGLSDASAAGTAAGADDREVLGRTMDADGHPHWRVRIGSAEIEDTLRPRLASGGSEFVRTIRVAKGTLHAHIAPTSGEARLDVSPAGTCDLQPGQSLEIVYRW